MFTRRARTTGVEAFDLKHRPRPILLQKILHGLDSDRTMQPGDGVVLLGSSVSLRHLKIQPRKASTNLLEIQIYENVLSLSLSSVYWGESVRGFPIIATSTSVLIRYQGARNSADQCAGLTESLEHQPWRPPHVGRYTGRMHVIVLPAFEEPGTICTVRRVGNFLFFLPNVLTSRLVTGKVAFHHSPFPIHRSLRLCGLAIKAPRHFICPARNS